MNSGTLIGSVIFAAVLVALIALVIQSMVRGWQRRAQRQAALVGTLPAVPDTVGSPIVAPTRGVYVGCTLTPNWHDRIAVGDPGYRTKAVLTRYPEGIMVQRSGAGKVAARNGMLAIRWRLPSGTEIDTGFRGDDRREHARRVTEDAG